MTAIRAGLVSENLFIYEALARGLNISIPVGNHLPYDLIVDGGHRVYKVQVKSTAGQRIKVVMGFGKKQRYELTDFDVVAMYLATVDEWYLIPFTGVTSISLEDGKTKYKKYLNNWGIFNEEIYRSLSGAPANIS